MILLVIFLVLALVQFNVFKKILSFFDPVEKIKIVDKCSILFKNIIHDVKTDEDCKIRCINSCSVLEKKFYSSNFTALESDCNICDCYCK